ncbi:hypothetical protein [Flavobacterium quisquiliarum]|uniref:SMODS-associated NUDIX domain-containing protein n=1 Tax=Flavobacterium quisquiliarum TaxID=1834436 RepID=A0ABV8WE34_9FLAO|nr:hypothetical protein [Flavobacterium quisquiliarum]MBW1658274.1 hypothetical protein [Flavobacterium quisquiliarum]NWL02197.1 hypothetical protein [Flavobacterium collinsii]
MLFSASIFIPEKPKFFNLTRSEKLSYISLGLIFAYALILLLIERFLDYKLPQYFYYPVIIPLILQIVSSIIRLTEFENLNGYFEGKISFEENFLTINEIEYKYSDLENLVIYGNSFSGEKTKNYRYGPMYGNGVENLISFTYNEIKIEKHFQLISERHLDQLQNALVHIITTEKLPYKREHLNFINKEYRSFILFELFIGKLIKEKRMECHEGIHLIGLKSKKAKEFEAKYCN